MYHSTQKQFICPRNHLAWPGRYNTHHDKIRL